MIYKILAFFAFAFPLYLTAQFRETSYGVYQSVAGTEKVIVGFKDGAQGIFVMASETPIPLQQFNIETTPRDGINHIFIAFDQDSDSYSEVVIGNYRYKITGSFSVKITPDTEVGVDPTNPYVSITTPKGIIGFFGLNKIIEGGPREAAVLAAHQLDSELTKLIKPYSAGPDGLLLDGKPLQTKTVGIKSDKERQSNICLKPETLLFPSSDLAYIKKGHNDSEKVKRFEEITKKNAKQPKLLFLRVSKEMAYALNPSDQSVKIIQEIKTSNSRRRVCEVGELQ